tara:strand:+ start:2996 stop:4441 length:1446 start_codon:yes stop_codon:yes gene_type:complete
MNILIAHLLFLFISIVTLYLLRKEKIIGLIHIILSALSFLGSLYIIKNQTMYLQNTIDLIYIIPGISISFGLDHLGLIFLIISNGLWFMTSLYSERYLNLNEYKNKSSFFIFFTFSMFATNAIIYSSNLLTTFIFYEILTLATYPLVTFKKDEKSIINGKKYLYYLLGTSIIFLLPAIILTQLTTGTLDYRVGGIFDNYDSLTISLLAILFMFGVAKSAIMPFHKWLPSAMVAPTPVSALLHAVAVVKSGVFILMKIMLYIFGVEVLKDTSANNFIILFASITIIVSSIIALNQNNIKLRLAYSTIGQLSYIVLATAILAPYSIMAATLHLIFHALGKIILFLSAGIIATQTGIKEVSEMNNLSRKLPITCFLVLIGAFIMIGLPPTVGFISKWYLLIGIMESDKLYLLIIIIISTLLNAGYYFPIIYKSYFEKESSSDAKEITEDISLVFPVMIIGAIVILLFFNISFITTFIDGYIIRK